MKNIQIHTIEFSYNITLDIYKELEEFFYSQKKIYYPKNGSMYYLGFKDRGIRIKMTQYETLEGLNVYTLKYIITPLRYIDKDNYLGLTDIPEIITILNNIGDYLTKENCLLPTPLDCRITRIDFTRNIYVGDNIEYIIQLLNRCYIPCSYKKNYKNADNNATFTKYNSKGQKIFELSFYDKYAEMKQHEKYNEEILEKARGVLRMEFRLYASRLKNLKKSYPYKTAWDFLKILNYDIDKIINKNIRSLYMAGRFYKLDEIKDTIDFCKCKGKTKNKMREFIKLAVKHKSANMAALKFEDKYSEEDLKIILKKFNHLGIIPVPISVRQPFDEWSFVD